MKNSSQWDVNKTNESNFWVTPFGKEIVCNYFLCCSFPGAGTRTQWWEPSLDQADEGNCQDARGTRKKEFGLWWGKAPLSTSGMWKGRERHICVLSDLSGQWISVYFCQSSLDHSLTNITTYRNTYRICLKLCL